MPPEYRQHEVLRRYPVALASMAGYYADGCVEGARRGYRACRRELAELVPPHAVDGVWLRWFHFQTVLTTDRAGTGTPELRSPGSDAEGGRGLQLVAGLAARWGWRRRGGAGDGAAGGR